MPHHKYIFLGHRIGTRSRSIVIFVNHKNEGLFVLADYLQKFWVRLANILQKTVQHSGSLLQN